MCSDVFWALRNPVSYMSQHHDLFSVGSSRSCINYQIAIHHKAKQHPTGSSSCFTASRRYGRGDFNDPAQFKQLAYFMESLDIPSILLANHANQLERQLLRRCKALNRETTVLFLLLIQFYDLSTKYELSMQV